MLLLREGRKDTLMVSEKHTHPVKPTLGSNETSREAKELVEELQNVLRCEEAWYIAEEHLSRARAQGRSIEHQYADIVEELHAETV
jgi:hypothetical protein